MTSRSWLPTANVLALAAVTLTVLSSTVYITTAVNLMSAHLDTVTTAVFGENRITGLKGDLVSVDRRINAVATDIDKINGRLNLDDARKTWETSHRR